MWRWLVAYWMVLNLIPPQKMAEVRYISTTGRFNPKYISHLSMSIAKDPHGLDVDVNLTHPIETDFFASVDVQIRLQDSTRYQSLFQENFDVCQLVNNITVVSLMKRWYHNLLKYGNFMDKCPVEPGYYIIRGLVVEQESLPLYLRPGDYRIAARGYNEMGETVVDGQLEVKWISG